MGFGVNKFNADMRRAVSMRGDFIFMTTTFLHPALCMGMQAI
jgi:hypothetical protein